jgi:hypothetical protein
MSRRASPHGGFLFHVLRLLESSACSCVSIALLSGVLIWRENLNPLLIPDLGCNRLGRIQSQRDIIG